MSDLGASITQSYCSCEHTPATGAAAGSQLPGFLPGFPLAHTISICTPIYSHFLHSRTSYQHLAGKLSPHLVFLGNSDRKRKKKCKSDNNIGTRLWSTALLPNHSLSFPRWSKPALPTDTTNQKAEQPEHTETCHQKNLSSLICSDIPKQLTTKKGEKIKENNFYYYLLYESLC